MSTDNPRTAEEFEQHYREHPMDAIRHALNRMQSEIAAEAVGRFMARIEQGYMEQLIAAGVPPKQALNRAQRNIDGLLTFTQTVVPPLVTTLPKLFESGSVLMHFINHGLASTVTTEEDTLAGVGPDDLVWAMEEKVVGDAVVRKGQRITKDYAESYGVRYSTKNPSER